MVATEQFQSRHYARRGWAHDLVPSIDDGQVAFDRWMQRDSRFAIAVAEQARRRGFQTWVTDGSTSLERTARALIHILEL